ncbi:MAG: transporter substrate-binding domain-containing protein [Clostridia bacterium]|nr:transporter substrate-binding domain-containing protein [Clostridia bacterium]
MLNKMTKLRQRLLCLMAALMLLMTILPAASGADAQQSRECLRVGWYQLDMFQEGMGDDAPKSGYSYDYLQKVSNYTGWQYEYVYGTWPELFGMLERGEIDLLAGVSATAERRQVMLFPDSAMG